MTRGDDSMVFGDVTRYVPWIYRFQIFVEHPGTWDEPHLRLSPNADVGGGSHVA